MSGGGGAHVVFIPATAVGHLVSTVEIAKVLLGRDDRLSITIVVLRPNPYAQTLAAAAAQEDGLALRFLELPLDDSAAAQLRSVPRHSFFSELIRIQYSQVRDWISENCKSETHLLSGIVVDMFCTPFVDVASEFRIPSYVFLTSGAAFLGLLFHLQALQDQQNMDIAEYKDSNAEFSVPTFVNSVPANVFPSNVFDKQNPDSTSLLKIPRKFRETKGILLNTFSDLEPHAVNCLSQDDSIPPIYPVGALLNLNNHHHPSESATIISWLDNQPPSSVVYLCFGSMSTFEKNQAAEIALALESAKCRFLWTLRRAGSEGLPPTTQFENSDEFLPQGFLDRTVDVGMVIGWAPQVAVLSHPAVGGFVSHCGWNSTLESLWFGVPIATWPLHAEQQLNAFELVRELGLAVEIKIDSRKEVLVTAEEIEGGIRTLMDPIESTEIREKVKQMKEISRGALEMGSSSYSVVGRFIEDFINNSTKNL